MSTRKKASRAPVVIDVSDNAETMGMIMPRWAQTLGDFAREWAGNSGDGVMKICEQLRGLAGQGKKKISMSEFLLPPLQMMSTVTLHGFHLRYAGGAKAAKRMEKKAAWLPGEAAMMAADIAREWFLCDNACAMWVKDGKRKSGAPAVTVLNTERIVGYSDGFTGEQLKIQALDGGGTKSLSDEEAKQFSPKWAAAIRSGGEVELKSADGEFYRIRCRTKRGSGLARPSLEGALPLIGMMELLALADRAGAWEHRNVIRQWLIGHDIRYGPRSGMADHFIKAGHVKSLKAKLAGKVGPFDLYTNFDWAIKYNFFPTEFFKKEKYEGGLLRMEQWFGPVGKLLRHEIAENDIPVVRAWIDGERAVIGGLLEDILNSPEYWGGKKPDDGDRISIGWSPVTLMTAKHVLELARFASAQGAIGQQTAREMLGFCHEQERQRLADEKGKDGNEPNFEQKQGLLTTGKPGGEGRPSE